MAPLRGAEKNAGWVWLAVERERKQVLDAVVGAREEQPGARRFASLARHCFQLVCTDYYRPYRNLVPGHLPYRSKAETTLVESGNRLLRHDRARFGRGTKCDSKGKRRLLQAVLLLRAKKKGTSALLLLQGPLTGHKP